MNMRLCAILTSVVLIGNANADVIVGDARFIDLGANKILITADLSGGLAVLITELGGGGYQFGPEAIGDAYNLYSATPGLEFTPIEAMDWESMLWPGTGPVTFFTNETKYYAYWEDVPRHGATDNPDSGDNYGWVSMIYTGTDLEITDSATARGGGIIVGTYEQIPEPSIMTLLTLGSCGIALSRRRRRSHDPGE